MPIILGPLALFLPTLVSRVAAGYMHGALLGAATLWSLWYLCTLERR